MGVGELKCVACNNPMVLVDQAQAHYRCSAAKGVCWASGIVRYVAPPLQSAKEAFIQDIYNRYVSGAMMAENFKAHLTVAVEKLLKEAK